MVGQIVIRRLAIRLLVDAAIDPFNVYILAHVYDFAVPLAQRFQLFFLEIAQLVENEIFQSLFKQVHIGQV